MTTELIHGDCIAVMRTLPDNSVDSIVTDPPYGLGFMGKEWDALPPGLEWAEECLRVLKPGGHLLAFGGTRTWHRLAVAVEDAGFEIRDSIAWMYGSGFPKSLDVSKAIDKVNGEGDRLHKFTRWMRTTGLTARQLNEATGTNMGSHYLTDKTQPAIPTPDLWAVVRPLCGDVPEWVDVLVDRIAAEREVVGAGVSGKTYGMGGLPGVETSTGDFDITAPATDAAKQWQGWGTALKPAFEPVVVGRKPFPGTVAANVLEYGTGALNIDACRLAPLTSEEVARSGRSTNGGVYGDFNSVDWKAEGKQHPGRWPANVILDEHSAELLDEQSGVSKSPPVGSVAVKKALINQVAKGDEQARISPKGHGDSGGASRFFYVAKAPKRERPVVDGTAHATVKPLALMRYLVKLVTPAGGTVLEPFAGSGTTVEACILDGFNCIAIEREAEYLPLIQVRIHRAVTSLMEDLL